MNNKNNYSKTINEENKNKKFALYNVACYVVCGYVDNDEIYIDDVFPIVDVVTDYFTRDCSKIISKFFDKIVKDLNLKERHRVIVNEKERELFITRPDGSFVLLCDFFAYIKATGNAGELFSVKSRNEESVA